MSTEPKPLTPYRHLSNELILAGAHCIAECDGFNEGQHFELWIVPGRQQPVLIQRYSEKDGGGFQDWYPNDELDTCRTVAKLIAKEM